MLIDKICLAENDPVLGKPTVDGFTGIEDAGIITTDADPGYGLGHRITYGNGSFFPPVVFQGVKELGADFLYLSFLVRYDLSFDDEDLIVIALRENAANQTQDDTIRRLDIYPVHDAIGASGGADDLNDMNGRPISDPNWHIRSNRSAFNIEHRKGQAAGNPWVNNAAPNTLDVKVRSWQPPTLSTSSAASAQTVPANGSFTFNAITTDGFPSSGAFLLPGNIYVSYTGKTATSFTGCTNNSHVSQTINAGTTITMPESAWSVEVKLPRTKLVGGNDWINLNDGFGLYFNVFRLSKSTTPPFVVQYTFPYDTNLPLAKKISAGAIGDDSQLMVNPAWYGRVGLPSLVQGTNCGQGVRFVNASENSIGSRSTLNAGALSNQIKAKDSQNNLIPAYLVAQVENTSTTDTATGITAEFRFANWGLGPQNFFAWNKDNTLLDNPTPAPGLTLTPNANGELIATWPAGSIPSAYKPPKHHQCMWVQLSSPNGVNFIQASMRRNMDFVGLSEYERPAYVSGVGYEPPQDGSGQHEFVLFNHVRKIVVPTQGRPDIRTHMNSAVSVKGDETQNKDMTYWIWVVNGYRRTGETVDIKGKTFEILDDSPGAFGYVASHEGTTDVLTYELSGGGLKHEGGSMYSLSVPDGGEVEIHTRLKAAPPSRSEKLPWWLWLVLILLLILLFILF